MVGRCRHRRLDHVSDLHHLPCQEREKSIICSNTGTTITRYSGRINSSGTIALKPEEQASWVNATGALETGKWYTVSIKGVNNQAAQIRVSERDSGANVIDHTATFDG